MPTPQEIIDQYNDQPDYDLMIEKLEELPEVKENWRQNKDMMVNVNLYHGTRRKETPEELKKNGFCSFARGEVEEFIDEAVNQCKVGIKAGPRVCYWMDETAKQLKSSYSGRDWEFTKEGAQPNLYATYNPKKGCNWAFRNPEIIHDAFYYRTPTVVMDEILTELFGTPKTVKVRIAVKLNDLLGNPHNLNTEKHCFRPEEILEVTECSHEDVVEAYGGRMPKNKFDGGWINKY
jgi:hypothetical protein